MTFSLIETVVDLVTTVLSTIGLPGLFALMVLESFGLPPVPSEVILPFSGFLVAEHVFPLDGALAAALAGGLVGSYLGYAVGRWWRHRILGLGFGALRLQPRHLERMDRFFARHGEATVGLARLLPVVRSYISYPAGTARMEPVRFGLYTLAGSIPFTVAFVWAGMLLGNRWGVISQSLRPFDYVAVAVVVAAIVYLILLIAGVITTDWPPKRGPRLHRAVPASVPEDSTRGASP